MCPGDLIIYTDLINPYLEPKVGLLLSDIYETYFDKQYAWVLIDSTVCLVRKAGLKLISDNTTIDQHRLVVSACT